MKAMFVWKSQQFGPMEVREKPAPKDTIELESEGGFGTFLIEVVSVDEIPSYQFDYLVVCK